MTDLVFPDYSADVSNGSVSNEIIEAFQQFVFSFYTKNGRHDMVWRHTTDPYLITVSEIMLQQTQVPRVESIYPKFIQKFPTLDALALATEAEVLSAWQGMGYNRRALSLQKLCRIILDEYNGIFPDNPETLVNLPGIGPATSCSIVAFAFNRPVVFIETNIRRIYIHCFFRNRETVDDTELKPLVATTLPPLRTREWYWALMDLGSVMKPITGNPNRKSKQYVKQSTFTGSTRQARGALLKHLLAVKTATTKELADTLALSEPDVRKILESMTSEGFFVQQSSDSWKIKSSKTP